MVLDGIQPGTLGFRARLWSYRIGRTRAHWIGDKQQPVKMKTSDGFNINDIGMIDPTREGKGVLLDCGGCGSTSITASLGFIKHKTEHLVILQHRL